MLENAIRERGGLSSPLTLLSLTPPPRPGKVAGSASTPTSAAQKIYVKFSPTGSIVIGYNVKSYLQAASLRIAAWFDAFVQGRLHVLAGEAGRPDMRLCYFHRTSEGAFEQAYAYPCM